MVSFWVVGMERNASKASAKLNCLLTAGIMIIDHDVERIFTCAPAGTASVGW